MQITKEHTNHNAKNNHHRNLSNIDAMLQNHKQPTTISLSNIYLDKYDLTHEIYYITYCMMKCATHYQNHIDYQLYFRIPYLNLSKKYHQKQLTYY